MRILPVFFLVFFAFHAAHGDPYSLFREKDKIGIKDDAGKVIIPAAFDALGWSDGSFSVVSGVTGYKLNDQWGLINLKKEFLSRAAYESVTCAGGDRVVVRKKINAVMSAMGCLNLKGEEVVPFIYSGIRIVGLRAVVFIRDKTRYRYGLIDLNGKEIISPQYQDIRPLGTLRYAVENSEHKTALFSDEGVALTEFKIDSISSFRNGVAILYQDQKQGMVDRDGEIKIPPVYREIRVGEDESISARAPDTWTILSGENKQIRELEADDLLPLGKNLYHIVKGKFHGIARVDFKIVLPMDYNSLGTLTDSKLVASREGKFGVIHTDGSVVLPLQFDSLILEGKIVRVRNGHAWSLYDTFGIRKTQKEFDFIGSFNGRFYPARKNGFWGGIDRYGNVTIQCVYDSLLQQSDDHVVVKFRSDFGVISTSDTWVVPPQSLRIALRAPDRYSVISGKILFIRDFAGHDIYFTENKLEFHETFMVETSENGTDKKVGYDGRIIERSSPAAIEKIDRSFPESEGLRGIRKDGKYGFVDARGRLRISNRYDGIGVFQEGLVAVKILGKWGYLDPTEKIVVQPVYELANEFSNGTAIVARGGKFGMIDKQGKVLLAVRYDSIISVEGKNFLLKNGTAYGLSDARGQLLLDTRYDAITDLGNGYCIIRRDGKFGLLTLHGISTIPLIYDHLSFDREKNEYIGVVRSTWKSVSVR